MHVDFLPLNYFTRVLFNECEGKPILLKNWSESLVIPFVLMNYKALYDC